ncbi:acetylcholine receptor subunit alpha-like isoform X2 [Drosophila erecta]|uniref:acetylcholine receptor subunit alpha-like isoform X2 n=1 Tax=Drosophila erecta TaxID=7220 RepID=UPI000F04A4A4|nr:acetylcholine receptor subunit alpha-like isoform X2 [Drosophila erecta]
MMCNVDLRHMDEQQGSNVVAVGVDLSEFYMSVEWDILEVPAVRNEKFYTCCDEPYLDITFNITMRRKTLFYTVNIIIPCMGISFLTVLTFYLPSDSGEKVTLSISILISLHVFFLLVVEIIPPTSLVVPLLGKYLIFAMILVSISICVTVVVLNVHFRSPQTHKMAPWVKRVFIDFLPAFLFIKRPTYNFETSKLLLKDTHACFYPYYSATNIDRLVSSGYNNGLPKEELSQSITANGPFGGSCQVHGPVPPLTHCSSDEIAAVPDMDIGSLGMKSPILNNPAFSHSKCLPKIHKSCFCVRFIAEHTKMQEDSTKVKEDWKYVAMVLDRLFLWIFTLAVVVGTAGIILQAPTLYDDRIPIIEQKDLDFSGTSAGRCRPPQ